MILEIKDFDKSLFFLAYKVFTIYNVHALRGYIEISDT